MRDRSVPTFDECEQVYDISRGRRSNALLALVLAAGFAYFVWSQSDELDFMAWIVWGGVAALIIYAACVFAAARGNRVGIHTDGLLIRKWPRAPRYIRWADIVSIEEMSGQQARGGMAYGRRLSVRVRTDNDGECSVPVCEVGEGLFEDVWRELDGIRDAVIHRAGLRDTGDISTHTETSLTGRRYGRRTVAVEWTTHNWYRPGDGIAVSRDPTAPQPGLTDCDQVHQGGAGKGALAMLAFPAAFVFIFGFIAISIYTNLSPVRYPTLLLMPLAAAVIPLLALYPALRERSARRRKVGLCDAGILIERGHDTPDFFCWHDVAGLMMEVRSTTIPAFGAHWTLSLYVGDPTGVESMDALPLVELHPGARQRDVDRTRGLCREILSATGLRYSEQLSSVPEEALGSGREPGTVTWIAQS